MTDCCWPGCWNLLLVEYIATGSVPFPSVPADPDGIIPSPAIPFPSVPADPDGIIPTPESE